MRSRQDQNGSPSNQVATPSLELPKGGGALKGIDEQFRSNPATGGMSFSIPLPLSPSRSGFTPGVSLSYDSGSGNGPFGLGWSLSVPSISRRTDRGLPEYMDGSDSDVFVLSGSEDLVPVPGKDRLEGDFEVRVYRPRIEVGFALIERWRRGDGMIHWRTVSADNVARVYGETAQARVSDPSDGRRTFQWLLEFSHDGNGSAASYEYKSGLGSSRCLGKILYGNKVHYDGGASRPSAYHFEASFVYGPRPDPFSSYRSCFEIRCLLRCERVLMRHDFGDRQLVRSLDFSYEQSASGISLLARAQESGHSPGGSKSLPAMSFSYQGCEWSDKVYEVDSESLSGLPSGLASEGSHFIDLYGEGVPGVLAESVRGWRYKRNNGDGRLGPPALLGSRPLAGSASGIQELEGDSEKYLADFDGGAPGFYRFEDGRAWMPRQAFRSMPSIDFNSPHVRMLDLDGDGRSDLLVDEGGAFAYYRGGGRSGFRLESRFAKGSDEDKGPRVAFSDREQSIFLADMSGDGLADIVRIRNGNVCYWPNLGHGRFGAKVAMECSPMMDGSGQFSASRARLADADGSGAADLIYIGAYEVSVWLNMSGNGFAREPRRFGLCSDSHSQVAALDFLGQGTACIVWSSPLPARARCPMRYIDLTGGKKPYLMAGYSNGMGKTAELEYTPSTKFYLSDRAAGRPWVTKLPFPVHCLSRAVVRDHVSGRRFASGYSYHHGYYDIAEREFRGFGCAEQTDSEDFGDALDQAPVLTRTWYHLGAGIKSKGILECYESEYHSVYKDELKLGQPSLCESWTGDERAEAMRAFKGMPLRQEVYALDAGDGSEGAPYITTQTSYEIRRLQPKGSNRHACFLVTQSESLSHHCERSAADPRIAHSIVLEADGYGRPLLSAEAAYGRKNSLAFDAEQEKCHVIATETEYAADALGAGAFRMGLECGKKTWELAGIAPSAAFKADELLRAFGSAEEMPFEAEPSGGLQKRLAEHRETLFYNAGLDGPLPLGEMAAHGLACETYTLSHTQSLLNYLYDGRATNAMLAEGGFEERDGAWRARSGRNIYEASAVSNFYLPSGVENAFGAATSIAYDQYNLLIASIADPLGNTVAAENDYRTLMPCMLADPNGNRTAIETDALGIVVKTAAMGKEGAGEGDDLDDPTAEMEYGFAEFDSDGKLLKPSWIRTRSRETHGDPDTRWMQKTEYSDGTGNVALVKTRAEPGRDGLPRWVGTGRTVLNNKGNPVRQYEPYFSGTDGWESEPEIRETGVTPVLRYDPLSRLVRTDFPDGTCSRIEFSAWERRDFDRCDTEESSPHYNTPTITHLDSLGRAFYAVADDGNGQKPATRTVLDIEGNEKKIIDARGNAAMEYKYGIRGEKGYAKGMDAGERRMLPAADGQPMYLWDARGNRLHVEYDALRRPASQKLSANGGEEKLVGMTVYGEEAPNPEAGSLRGQPWKVYGQSGMIENARYDFKGNLLESKRKFAVEYKEAIDWDASPALENETFTSITEYDALNRATSIYTPRSDEIMPAYDEGGMLKAVKAKLKGVETDFVTGISYNPKGQRERIKYGNGAKTKYEYDEKTFRLKRLLTTRSSGTEKLQDLSYAYDQMGNITEITDEARQSVFFNGQAANPSQAFEYDALYRLIKATGREHVSVNADTEPEAEGYNPAHVSPEDGSAMRLYARQWEYDEAGNILKLIHQANNNNWTRDYNYAANSNRLNTTAVGQAIVNYNYNEHGSMISMPHLQLMEWDFEERLNHVARGTTEAYYNYDGSGQRTRKVVEKGNIVEERLYLGGFEIFRKRVGSSLELERETLHIMDDKRRIAVAETLTVSNGTAIANPVPVQRYQLSNNIESATLELDENANTISYEEYYPYGETSYRAGRNIAEVGLKRYRYTGKEKDEESGLYYYGARYYACWLGRWTAADPAGLVDGLNLYMYCRGSPITFLDDEGKQPQKTNDEGDFSVYINYISKMNEKALAKRDKTETRKFINSKPLELFNNSQNNNEYSPLDVQLHIPRFVDFGYDNIAQQPINFGNFGCIDLPPRKLFDYSRAYNTTYELAINEFKSINDISKAEGCEYGGVICKIGDKHYLVNVERGSEDKVTIGDCPIGERVGDFHTHGSISEGAESFSVQDFIDAYKYGTPSFLMTPSEVIRKYTPPNTGLNSYEWDGASMEDLIEFLDELGTHEILQDGNLEDL